MQHAACESSILPTKLAEGTSDPPPPRAKVRLRGEIQRLSFHPRGLENSKNALGGGGEEVLMTTISEYQNLTWTKSHVGFKEMPNSYINK